MIGSMGNEGNESQTVHDGLAAKTTCEEDARTIAGDSPFGFSSKSEHIAELMDELRKAPSVRLTSERVIARGGMGEVELVVDSALKRRLAKKIIHPELQATTRTLWMFIREARITSQLDHPNIVPVHDAGEDEMGRLYFTMKRVEGRTLSAIFKDLPRGRIPREVLFRMLSIIVKVCDAVAFAHSRGVLHCDLKPANIMVGDFGQVYVMDWGVAKVMDDEVPDAEPLSGLSNKFSGSTSAAIMGTPNYMSPEQARGERAVLDERTDVFSIGAILYRMLTRCAPYRGSDFDAVVELAQVGEFRRPMELAGSDLIPWGLEKIVLKALAKDPVDRYQTIDELEVELERFMRGGEEFPTAIYGAGQHVVREGEVGDSAYIVATGSCEVYRIIDGQRISLRRIGPGEVFGETAVLTSAPRVANVIALEDGTALYVVTAAVLDLELSEMKPWLASLMRTLAERFRRLEDERSA